MVKKKDFILAKTRLKMTPGEIVRTLRDIENLSQRELAERAGMEQSHISALETGAVKMGRERAIALARAFKIHPTVIMFPQFDPDSTE